MQAYKLFVDYQKNNGELLSPLLKNMRKMKPIMSARCLFYLVYIACIYAFQNLSPIPVGIQLWEIFSKILKEIGGLKHYREHYLNLSPYPSLDEKTPLITHAKNVNRPITSERPIRKLVQVYFDLAANQLEVKGEKQEADSLRDATVHWLRHTGISEDVKHRPREHVRDDAGHSSGAITDRYIDVELLERAQSAKKKSI